MIKRIIFLIFTIIINERFPRIAAANKKQEESLKNTYPHLSGYFRTSDIGFSLYILVPLITSSALISLFSSSSIIFVFILHVIDHIVQSAVCIHNTELHCSVLNRKQCSLYSNPRQSDNICRIVMQHLISALHTPLRSRIKMK